MTDPRNIHIKDYLYELPDHRIAEFPLENRDRSKLLAYTRGNIPREHLFGELPDLLPANCVLVLNDTRVIHARLLFQKGSGARIEIFCLNPLEPVRDLQLAFARSSPVVWECLIGNSRRWKEGVLSLQKMTSEGDIKLKAERVAGDDNGYPLAASPRQQRVQLSWLPEEKSLSSIIETFGTVPLPPYIHRESQESDKQRYQTVYARQEGSVAAPTAGLHFTPAVFDALGKKGIDTACLTLHVGAGTFKPVTTETVGDHIMHAEPFYVSLELLEDLLSKADRPFIAVGTTSVRTLESLYYAGLRLLQGTKSLENLMIGQWEPYDQKTTDVFSRKEVLQCLVSYLRMNRLPGLNGSTRLLIAPGYTFHFVKGMVTNFHQPGSTLLLLIAALLGDEWKKIYDFALQHEFRFLSYGDSCLFM